jgi:hypothetical protein
MKKITSVILLCFLLLNCIKANENQFIFKYDIDKNILTINDDIMFYLNRNIDIFFYQFNNNDFDKNEYMNPENNMITDYIFKKIPVEITNIFNLDNDINDYEFILKFNNNCINKFYTLEDNFSLDNSSDIKKVINYLDKNDKRYKLKELEKFNVLYIYNFYIVLIVFSKDNEEIVAINLEVDDF